MNKSIIEQVKIAFGKGNRLAAFFGAVLGAIIPASIWFIAHFDIDASKGFQISYALVAAGLMFSAKTVFDWGCMAFKQPLKAFGFVVLIEGIMTFSHLVWLSVVTLIVLMTINGIATGCNLVLDYRSNKKR